MPARPTARRARATPMPYTWSMLGLSTRQTIGCKGLSCRCEDFRDSQGRAALPSGGLDPAEAGARVRGAQRAGDAARLDERARALCVEGFLELPRGLRSGVHD